MSVLWDLEQALSENKAHADPEVLARIESLMGSTLVPDAGFVPANLAQLEELQRILQTAYDQLQEHYLISEHAKEKAISQQQSVRPRLIPF